MAGQSSDFFNLLPRLELLDGQVRRLKQVLSYVLIFFGILLVLLIVGLLRVRLETGEGERFILRDEDGKRRADLVVAKGIPVLEFYDDDNQLLGGLKMSKGESSFLFFDEHNKLRGRVGVLKGRAGLVLYDTNGKLRVNLALTAAGESLVFQDEKEKPRAVLAVDNKGPHLLLLDENGKAFFSQPPQP